MNFFSSKTVLKKSASNTFYCLLGCSIGDFGTIYLFQLITHPYSSLSVMIIAIVNGLISSILLETFILIRQMTLIQAFKTAINMSFISMISMEITMNGLDYLVFGEPLIKLWLIPFMLIVGFLTAWPYNYWRLKKYNVSCH